ncbi:hypothetical protein K438DRAFT_1877455 [Mycena galopus ATCC 62051]|nr:hypothetical protein K438DRAFT_1877455 [Mycena galopus ATCC 62051]
MTPQLPTISLRLHKGPWVAGKIIEGRVAVNVAEAQKDHIKQVSIKFQGAIATYEFPHSIVPITLRSAQKNPDEGGHPSTIFISIFNSSARTGGPSG